MTRKLFDFDSRLFQLNNFEMFPPRMVTIVVHSKCNNISFRIQILLNKEATFLLADYSFSLYYRFGNREVFSTTSLADSEPNCVL